ncbi:ATP-binding protein [Rubrobacter calidifluminis]|uniref:DNA polymerase III subunit n=1 Tax=Rubrobacter calidifluminis TaxID=1392640 RepID=UPI0023604693|nr:hypothetical protein [Rubrobacter calidifluminis]
MDPIFDGVIGNPGVRRLLSGALKSGDVSHAYLFYGPEGVGKRTVALRFAAALVGEGDRAVRGRIMHGLHPDVVEVLPDGAFTTIGQVREVIRGASSRPFEGARRVFILRADTLNLQSANALLKTLEEPEGETVFILLSTSREEVLPTVASRARGVRFDPVPLPEVEGFLAQRGAENPALAASLGRGSVGRALRYATEEEMLSLRDTVLSAAFDLSSGMSGVLRHAGEIASRAEEVGERKEREILEAAGDPDRRAREEARRAGRAAREEAAAEALDLLKLAYRDAAVTAAGAPELVANLDRRAEIGGVAANFDGADWTGAAREADEGRESLAYNASPEAVLEVVLSRARRKILGTSRDW